MLLSCQTCWNCGRKATETCSGCSIACYCGPFCQHRDWVSHQLVCRRSSAAKGHSPTASISQSPPTPAGQDLSVGQDKCISDEVNGENEAMAGKIVGESPQTVNSNGSSSKGVDEIEGVLDLVKCEQPS